MSLSLHEQEAAAKLLPDLLAEEERLQFTRFSNDDALALGCKLIALAKQRVPAKGVTVAISRNGQLLFHHAMDGTTVDNENWIRRKTNTVNRLQHSSYYIGRLLASKGETTMEKNYMVSTADYACHGGAFPLLIRGVGCVGAIVLSGLRQDLDHEVVTQGIREYLVEQN
ncbi:hypothetical protein CPC16_002613 [Podila verticillata]|nr:hypothetical protein BGZ52_012539 [Haplosporangium bisporale]KAF9212787.1 hypothetical protein BGZ59_006322 [Podila verticillata]KAF9393178.1 hypothetical protein CPC16_002613 [Podila verticillata]KAI9239039.1 MAG: hypothetical protein BYD32DRAFT_412228 [Podila humilis]KFH68213.1 hypothetical protein MVEG_05032 [Podila verticillata NRRL 6337]